jgi:iron complex transport system substrate-binding protein
MNVGQINILALVLAFGLAVTATLTIEDQQIPTSNQTATYIPVKTHSGPGLVDLRGQTVPVYAYQRIASLNTIADRLLLELVEPDRLVAVTAYSIKTHPDGWRYKAQEQIETSDDIEAILATKPDLVIASPFTNASYIARLKDEGIEVFDLGPVRGVTTTLANIDTLAALVDAHERGKRLERNFRHQLEALEAKTRRLKQKKGLYLTFYADSFFGGTVGSSYADLLHYGGVKDVAAEHGYQDWPKYSPAQVLEMSPEMIITQTGMGKAICRHSALRSVPACNIGGRIIELPDGYHSDPGLGLVHAADMLRTLVYKQ